jgi:hypothetical protein
MRQRRFFPQIYEETNKGHGRVEIRRIVVANTNEISTINFPGAKQIFRIEREVWRSTSLKSSLEIAYGITSLDQDTASPNRLLRLNREHWSIENKSHYVRDVTFSEDYCRSRTVASPSVLASLRNAAISMIRLSGGKSVAASLRNLGRNPLNALRAIGIVVEPVALKK